MFASRLGRDPKYALSCISLTPEQNPLETEISSPVSALSLLSNISRPLLGYVESAKVVNTVTLQAWK
jgi:hypothetical protein